MNLKVILSLFLLTVAIFWHNISYAQFKGYAQEQSVEGKSGGGIWVDCEPTDDQWEHLHVTCNVVVHTQAGFTFSKRVVSTYRTKITDPNNDNYDDACEATCVELTFPTL